MGSDLYVGPLGDHTLVSHIYLPSVEFLHQFLEVATTQYIKQLVLLIFGHIARVLYDTLRSKASKSLLHPFA